MFRLCLLALLSRHVPIAEPYESDEGLHLPLPVRMAVDRAERPLWPDDWLPPLRLVVLAGPTGTPRLEMSSAAHRAARSKWRKSLPPPRPYPDEEYES